MSTSRPIRKSDLIGGTRLVADAATGIADLVEAMHARITSVPVVSPARPDERTHGLTGLVYGTVRATMRLVGSGVEALLDRVMPDDHGEGSHARREALVAVLNGVVGDHLTRTANPLATPMTLRSGDVPLPDDPAELAATLAEAESGVVILIHGLCMNDLQWSHAGRDLGTEIGRELGLTPLRVRYSSGLHVSINGRALAERLEQLVERWPRRLDRLVLIGHSMGGLVARSAVHHGREAGHRWPDRLTDLVFLGTPHQGAPLEQIGGWIDVVVGATPWVAPFARLGRMRSAGITDLRHGSLLDEDRADGAAASPRSTRHRRLPLPQGPRCHAIAASLARAEGQLSDAMVGDGLVPVASALGHHRDPGRRLDFTPEHCRVIRGIGHLDLMWDDEVRDQVRRWLDPRTTDA